jgi:hypothetical protein
MAYPDVVEGSPLQKRIERIEELWSDYGPDGVQQNRLLSEDEVTRVGGFV